MCTIGQTLEPVQQKFLGSAYGEHHEYQGYWTKQTKQKFCHFSTLKVHYPGLRGALHKPG
jgi:hypothetical protein